MQKITDPVHLKERLNLIGQEGARWKAHHAEAFAQLPEGTTVIIDFVSGDYVTGTQLGIWPATHSNSDLVSAAGSVTHSPSAAQFSLVVACGEGSRLR